MRIGRWIGVRGQMVALGKVSGSLEFAVHGDGGGGGSSYDGWRSMDDDGDLLVGKERIFHLVDR